jgi:hypothetical protein
MCLKIRTVQHYLCGCIDENVRLDLCEDYEQLGECLTLPEAWENREPVNLGSTRAKSKCAECKQKEEKSTQEATIKGG